MHVIRLRAAWKEDADGRRLRRFHCPTGLDGGERVWLAWEGDVTDARLNGEPLPIDPPRIDVTDRLRPTNELSLTPIEEACLSTVRLEIGAT